MNQPQLPFYPNQPGYRRAGTSKRAAEAMKPRAPSLKARVLEVLKTGDFTADEIAEKLGEDKGDIRPRCSELVKLKEIESTGEERPSSRGAPSDVLRRRRT